MKKVLLIIGLGILFTGCAATPPVSELRQGVQTVAYVQNGVEPLRYSTGVIDASSFWAAYGSQVGGQTGGALWHGLAAAGASEQLSKAEQNALLVKGLYGEHDLATAVFSDLMPKLARAWDQPYDEADLVVLADRPARVEEGVLKNFETNADLVLMLEVSNLNLTEIFSMGGAFAAGLTMGLNTKSLTTEANVVMRAFKPSETDPRNYELAWWRMCGPNYTTMDTSYTMEELQEKPERMQEILDEAKGQAIEGCSAVLANLK
ncbi:hypothetical protein [Microbulbifer yueqingensis]|uniref:Lipoprotein n=1 Tax=Microbulbifer yueqingensis TaxID=658219 RepID=A0A1G9BPI2_9GAMM|nr:hypothetical protein [Microbulbifer yueqingensis]SDK40775.1 hypothetical protein SAMN05216212_2302 [Microbulbifer yueqingensis]